MAWHLNEVQVFMSEGILCVWGCSALRQKEESSYYHSETAQSYQPRPDYLGRFGGIMFFSQLLWSWDVSLLARWQM